MSEPSDRSARSREKAADFEWLHAGSEEQSEKPRRRQLQRPAAMLCDAGELDDLYATLSELSHRPLRVRPDDVDDLRPWERPTRLFVTSVRVALDQRLELIRAEPDLVSIAVADGDAHTVANAMLRRGFRYVLRRPVHPEALRLLLMQVLYRGPEHRLATRFPFGGEVGWRSGLRRGRCVMSEISAYGCRLLTREPLARGARIRLKLPAALPGAGPLRLRGRVLRRDFASRGEPGERASHLVVQFIGLTRRSQAHLDALLAERASGPATARGPVPAPTAPRREERRGPSRFLTLTQTSAGADAPPAGDSEREVAPDQRAAPRSVWQGEVVALASEGDRVQHALMGTDLSEHGMRVEPHPVLVQGDRLRVALYDPKSAQPLVVEAWVARDDGARGCALAFERIDAATRARLRAMVAGAAPISSLGPGAKRASELFVGEIVQRRARR